MGQQKYVQRQNVWLLQRSFGCYDKISLAVLNFVAVTKPFFFFPVRLRFRILTKLPRYQETHKRMSYCNFLSFFFLSFSADEQAGVSFSL